MSASSSGLQQFFAFAFLRMGSAKIFHLSMYPTSIAKLKTLFWHNSPSILQPLGTPVLATLLHLPLDQTPRPARTACPAQGRLRHRSPRGLQLLLLLLLAPIWHENHKKTKLGSTFFATSDGSRDKSIASQQEGYKTASATSYYPAVPERARAEILPVSLGSDYNPARCEPSRNGGKDSKTGTFLARQSCAG